MARIIRRTLTITIQERWTFVWAPEQTNDSQVVAEAVLLSPAEIAQQLRQLLGLPAAVVNEADNPLQISIQSPSKESTDENTHP